MSSSGKEHVSASTNVELKAEVLKRRHEFLREKESLATRKRPSKPLFATADPKHGAVEPPSKKRPEAALADESHEQWSKSHEALLQKSRLYDRLTADPLQQYGTEEAAIDAVGDEKEAYLVDFLLKEDRADTTHSELRAAASSGEWTECTDEFGRTRLVRRADLEAATQPQAHQAHQEDRSARHYDAASEIRAKAVGYFRLSMDEAARAEQLDELSRLRSSTVESRARALILKEQKRLRMEQRLLIAANRRKMLAKKDK